MSKRSQLSLRCIAGHSFGSTRELSWGTNYGGVFRRRSMIISHFYRTAISCVLRKVNQTNCEINVYTVLCSHALRPDRFAALLAD